MKRFIKDTQGFTGLEAAIVLTAFVVVAAVFSYVVLGAGFFTTDTAKQVVHSGVEQATSSVVTNGEVVGIGDGTEITSIIFYLQLSAGNNPVNISNGITVISYEDSDNYESSIYTSSTELTWVIRGDTDTMLERGETAKITLDVSPYNLGSNEQFTLQLKPPVGAVLPITRTTPPAISLGNVILT